MVSFIVLARYRTRRLTGWIEEKIEDWLRLEINRNKTRVVDLGEDKASLDFPGYTFHWHRDGYGALSDICMWGRRRRHCRGSGTGLTR